MSTAEIARDRAIDAVAAAAQRRWVIAATAAVVARARTGQPFTAEDAAGDIPASITTHEPRAMGPVMLRALRDELVAHIGWTTARKTQSHAGPRRVYCGVAWLANVGSHEDQ